MGVGQKKGVKLLTSFFSLPWGHITHSFLYT